MYSLTFLGVVSRCDPICLLRLHARSSQYTARFGIWRADKYSQNYHWQWVSFLSAGSTAGYVFLYSMYYLWFKTHQSGFMQVSFFVGYM